MKHPTPEELVSWVYGETNNKQLSAHVKECAQCRAQVETWRGTMKTLDDLPAPVTRRRFATAPLQWAAAAALFLALGIVLGHFAIPTEGAKLRAAVQTETQQQIAAMRAELTEDFERRHRETVAQVVAAAEANIVMSNQRFSEEFAASLQQARAEDRADYFTALKELSAKHDAEVATLKKGIETIVALADYGFEATEKRFAQLAASASTQTSPVE